MKQSSRKAIGMLTFVIGLTVYCFAVMLIAISLEPWNQFFQAVYYLVFGVLWILPMKRLFAWMERPDKEGS